MRGPLLIPGARRTACLLLVLCTALAGLLASAPRAEAAAGDAVMRPTAVSLRADEILTADVLSNDDPPPGTTWDRSSVCLVVPGGCQKTYEGGGLFYYAVDEQGMIRRWSASRFGGVGAIAYQVRDSRGTAWRSQLDVTTGLTATGSGVPPADGPRPRLRVTQAVSPTTFDHAGQVLTWTSVVTNSGDVALPVTVTDASTSVSARTCAPVASGGTLAPGASTTCTATSTVRQDHIDLRADRTDAVRVGATTAVGSQRYRTYATATATSKPVLRPALQVMATTSPTTVTTADQQVLYRFGVYNPGNVTVRELLVRAPFPGLSALVCAPVALGGELPPNGTTACVGSRTLPRELLGTRTVTDTVQVTAKTLTASVNTGRQVSLTVKAPQPAPHVPVSGPPPVARADRVSTSVGEPVVVSVLGNDSPGSAGSPLVGSSVRLRLAPGLPDGSVLYGGAKSLLVPQGQPGPLTPAPGGAAFLVSGRGEITVVPLGYEPAPGLTVGYQVADADGRTARTTLRVTVGR